MGMPRGHWCLERGLGWSQFLAATNARQLLKPWRLAGLASRKIVVGKPRAGHSPEEMGTGAGGLWDTEEQTGGWVPVDASPSTELRASFCCILALEAGLRGRGVQALRASVMLLHRAGGAIEALPATEGKVCWELWGPQGGRGPPQPLPGSVVTEPKRGSPGDGGPAGTGLAPAGMCSKGGELRGMEFHPNESHLPVPAQPLREEGAGLVPSCPALSGLGAPGSWIPTLPWLQAGL